MVFGNNKLLRGGMWEVMPPLMSHCSCHYLRAGVWKLLGPATKSSTELMSTELYMNSLSMHNVVIFL